MDFKRLIGGAAIALLLTGGGAVAGSRGLPGVFDGQPRAPVVLAQASPGALEEEVRKLNGRIEELNFQIMQMQEQIRKMQEDNEFRFQELEGGGGAAAPKKKSDAADPAARTQQTAEAAQPAPQPAAPQPGATSTGAAPQDAAGDDPVGREIAAAQSDGSAAPGGPALQPRDMGTITFDENGNVVGGKVGDQVIIESDPNGAVQEPGADNTVVASLPKSDDPDTVYRSSYDFILQGQYATAEAGFADHIARFPKDSHAADAHFWLGEAQLGQRKYNQAAKTFLAASKAYPKAKKAPDMLLKLGVSLVGLNQRDIACATFSEVGKRYPNAGAQLRDRVKKEQAAAAC